MAVTATTNPLPTPTTTEETTVVPVAVTAAETPSETGDGDNNAVLNKKPAWNKNPIMSTPPLINGGEAEDGGATVVMGAELWPSLSECTKASPKPSISSDSSKVSEICMPSSTTVVSSMQSQSPTSQKLTTRNSNHHSTSNRGRPTRQQSMKREGGDNSQAKEVSSHQCSQSAGEGANNHLNHGSPKPNSSSSENFGRDNVQNQSHRESSQRNASGEHPHQRNSSRRGTGGSHSRGDGSHQNYGGRRSDHERGYHDFNHRRSFNGRDASMQPGVPPRGFVGLPPVFPQFAHHPHMRPVHPMMPPDVPMVYLVPGMPYYAPFSFVPALDSGLHYDIMKQINYYFSNENLVKDTYLRQKMDENGWVPVDEISKFNMVKCLTNDIHQILDALRHSTVVEVQGDKIRRRYDWKRWIMPPSVQFPTLSGSQLPRGQSVSTITNHIQTISLDEKINDSSIVKDEVDDSAPQTSVDEASGNGC